jgi:tRNA (adenine57-N1/adenine58-N1)-methyltransferase
MDTIADGDLIYIIHDQRRKWLRKIKTGEEFHTDKGFVRYSDLIGKQFGETMILAPTNRKVALLRPLPSDIVMNMRRESQIIYPEDIGLILTYGGIAPGMRIMEAGVGSGTVTSIMAMFCGPSGHIDTHDIRHVAIKQAKKNLVMMGVEDICEIHEADICKADLGYTNLDFVMLDLAVPWLAIPMVKKYLRSEGRICSFSPTFEQVRKVELAMKEAGFYRIIHLELVKRIWQVKPNASRPDTRMIGHTGYLTFASNIDTPLPPVAYQSDYAPETIGFLLIYAGVLPGHRVVIVSRRGDRLKQILTPFVGDNSSSHPELISLFTPESLENLPKDWENSIDTVILDNVIDIPFDRFYFCLKWSGVICGLSRQLGGAKYLTAELYGHRCYDYNTFELITRQLIIDPPATESESQVLPASDFITIGRKINDLYPEIGKKKKTEDAPEDEIDAGDMGPDEESKDKIDYSKLSPEEQAKMDELYLKSEIEKNEEDQQ